MTSPEERAAWLTSCCTTCGRRARVERDVIDAIRAAEEAEREACAKVADEFPTIQPATGSANVAGAEFGNLRGYIAAAIRARAKHKL